MRPSNKKTPPLFSPAGELSSRGQGQSNPTRGDATPLMFIIRDATNFAQGRKDAKAVASHVSSRYRGWRKTNRKQLVLDATTQAILGPKRRKVDGPSFESAAVDSRSTSLAPTDSFSETLSPGPSPVFTSTGPPTPTDITSLSAIGPNPATETGAETELDDDYQQLTSRLRLLSPTAESSAGAAEFAWRLFEDFVSPQPNLVGYHSLDPFSSFGPEMDLEMKSNLHFYFKVIHPFATHLIDSWAWLQSVSEAQSSKLLAYAVASFASLFLSGCLRGGPGVVLPPPVEQGQSCLWPIPPWLRLQTICLSELNAVISKSGRIDAACYQAMLFLFRISVLLADGPSARIHAKAMKRISSIAGMEKVKLNTELSVAKVNIISAFLHDESAVVLNHRPSNTAKQLAHTVELDRTLWPSDKVWYAHRGMMAGRVLTWREGEPADTLLERTEPALLRMDPQIRALGEGVFVEMQRCSQIALFLNVQLHGISFNTSTLRIRRNLEVLTEKLSRIDLQLAASFCPTTLFNILLAAAIASRGNVERCWYIETISHLFPQKLFMDDVMDTVAYFIDVYTLVTKLLEEVWTEVLDIREIPARSKRGHILWRKDLPWQRERARPLTRSPNLSKPRPRVEDWAAEDVNEVEPEFETGAGGSPVLEFAARTQRSTPFSGLQDWPGGNTASKVKEHRINADSERRSFKQPDMRPCTSNPVAARTVCYSSQGQVTLNTTSVGVYTYAEPHWSGACVWEDTSGTPRCRLIPWTDAIMHAAPALSSYPSPSVQNNSTSVVGEE